MAADRFQFSIWTLYRLVAALSPNRVVWPDIARRPRAIALDDAHARSAVPLNSCYVSAAPDRHTALIICAVMNSSFALALVITTADEARGGYHRVNARAVADLPIPDKGPAREELVRLTRRYQLHEQFDQGDLDAAVAEALGLATRDRDRLRRLASNHR